MVTYTSACASETFMSAKWAKCPRHPALCIWHDIRSNNTVQAFRLPPVGLFESDAETSPRAWNQEWSEVKERSVGHLRNGEDDKAWALPAWRTMTAAQEGRCTDLIKADRRCGVSDHAEMWVSRGRCDVC